MATKLTTHSVLPGEDSRAYRSVRIPPVRGSSASNSVAASGRKSHDARSVSGGSVATGPTRSP